MKEYFIPYGKDSLTARLPDDAHVDLIQTKAFVLDTEAEVSIKDAIKYPVGELRLEDFQGSRSVGIAINDKTRPVPNDILLPPLLDYLNSLGITDDAIEFFVATGTHTPMSSTEFSGVLPDDMLRRYRVVSHDCRDDSNLISLGTTSRGTPVRVNQRYFEKDLRIVVGNIEPHHFMGFSGGAKGASIGLAAWETINKNHSMLRHPKARLGNYSENPMRQDVEEIGKLINVHFALNAILTIDRKIYRVYAGEPRSVMAAGIPVVRELFEVQVDGPYDLIICSPGGHPRDINFYQAEKALSDAATIMRDGGTVIMVAACPEGAGSASYEAFMDGLHTYEAIMDKFENEPFRIGPHKAFQVARDASRLNVLLKSEMPDNLVKKLLLKPIKNFNEAVDLSILNIGDSGRIGIMQSANVMIPKLKV